MTTLKLFGKSAVGKGGSVLAPATQMQEQGHALPAAAAFGIDRMIRSCARTGLSICSTPGRPLLHGHRARRLRAALLRYSGWYLQEPRVEEGLEQEEMLGAATKR